MSRSQPPFVSERPRADRFREPSASARRERREHLVLRRTPFETTITYGHTTSNRESHPLDRVIVFGFFVYRTISMRSTSNAPAGATCRRMSNTRSSRIGAALHLGIGPTTQPALDDWNARRVKFSITNSARILSARGSGWCFQLGRRPYDVDLNLWLHHRHTSPSDERRRSHPRHLRVRRTTSV